MKVRFTNRTFSFTAENKADSKSLLGAVRAMAGLCSTCGLFPADTCICAAKPAGDAGDKPTP